MLCQAKASMVSAVIALDNDFNRTHMFNYHRHSTYSVLRRFLGTFIPKWLFYAELAFTKVFKVLFGKKFVGSILVGFKKFWGLLTAVKVSLIFIFYYLLFTVCALI